MAHGENAAQKGHPGKEYWKSRLHSGGEVPGRWTKKMTHKKERRKAKILIRQILHQGGLDVEARAVRRSQSA